MRETSGVVKSLRENAAQSEKSLEEELNAFLKDHKGLTISSLCLVYGLGTPEPSRFAIHMAEILNFEESCELLVRTEESQQQFTKFGVANPGATTAAIQRLGCKR